MAAKVNISLAPVTFFFENGKQRSVSRSGQTEKCCGGMEKTRFVAGDPALQLQTQPAETEYTKNMERPSTSKEKDR